MIIALLAIALFAIKKWQRSGKPSPKQDVTKNDRLKDPAGNKTDRDRGFDRRVAYLEYSNHAKCRMECRHISQGEVEEIMRDGKINYSKSDLKNARCPRYAVEGETIDDQNVRIVYAQCNDKTIVVTVIDLQTEWHCDCPGDN